MKQNTKEQANEHSLNKADYNLFCDRYFSEKTPIKLSVLISSPFLKTIRFLFVTKK